MIGKNRTAYYRMVRRYTKLYRNFSYDRCDDPDEKEWINNHARLKATCRAPCSCFMCKRERYNRSAFKHEMNRILREELVNA